MIRYTREISNKNYHLIHFGSFSVNGDLEFFTEEIKVNFEIERKFRVLRGKWIITSIQKLFISGVFPKFRTRIFRGLGQTRPPQKNCLRSLYRANISRSNTDLHRTLVNTDNIRKARQLTETLKFVKMFTVGKEAKERERKKGEYFRPTISQECEIWSRGDDKLARLRLNFPPRGSDSPLPVPSSIFFGCLRGTYRETNGGIK